MAYAANQDVHIDYQVESEGPPLVIQNPIVSLWEALMRNLTWKVHIVLFGITIMFVTALPVLGQQLIGTFTVSYRCNAGGCNPFDFNPYGYGNPYYCIGVPADCATNPPGPIHIPA